MEQKIIPLFTFSKPLERAVIVDRPNRFIVNVETDSGIRIKAHCPVTGSIGGLRLNGLPCLISEADPKSKRTTTHTMEAIAVEDYDSPNFQWVGINQNKVNRYVEEAILQGKLRKISGFSFVKSLKREPKINNSRLDFLVNDHIYVEVKTPIKNLQIELPNTVVRKDYSATGTERMLRQVKEMMEFVGEDKRAVLLTVFMYDNPGFKVPKMHNKIYGETVKAMSEASQIGLERWQVNLKINERGVFLDRVF